MNTISECHKEILESMRFPNSYSLMNHLNDDARVDTLLKQVGVTKADLLVANGTISGLPFKLLLDLNISAHDSPIPYSLNIAQEFNLATHGMLGLAIASAKNLEEALGLATQFTPLVNPAMQPSLHQKDGSAFLSMTCNKAFGSAAGVLLETSMMVLNQFLLQTRERVRPEYIEFDHATPFTKHYYEAYFQCPVYFERENTQMVIQDAALESPMRFYDKSTANILHDHLDEQLDRFKYSQNPWTVEVRNYLSVHLKDPSLTSKVAVADFLKITPRTLTRKLSQENTTFLLLLDELKLLAAKNALAQTNTPISKIAYEIGFNDPQTFSRAFKRWTGISAREYRQKTE
ncbi:hypothetical protein A9Q99_06450 [Gammaproteobacteria bacterium 45_16_T64]|nr:hypothetical protein A9Q99_06450 [Gammaproteobacteria bacterium 45_16_T64]